MISMDKAIFAVLALAFITSDASSQDAPQMLDLATARKLVVGAEAAAAALNQHVAITVMDGRGDLVLFERIDSVPAGPGVPSQGKAHAALAFGIPTGRIADAMQTGKPITATMKAPLSGAENMTFQRGGLPIIKDGKLIGSIACGGSPAEIDEKIAQAGIDAVFPKLGSH
jgi:glc operon protein GlcG